MESTGRRQSKEPLWSDGSHARDVIEAEVGSKGLDVGAERDAALREVDHVAVRSIQRPIPSLDRTIAQKWDESQGLYQ